MHEFSICSEIVRNVLDEVEKSKGRKVLSIQLEIGELTFLNLEQITFLIHELFKGTVAEGAKVKVKTVKASIKCESCGYKGREIADQKVLSHHYISISCPKCGSLEIKVEKGREFNLRKIQVVR